MFDMKLQMYDFLEKQNKKLIDQQKELAEKDKEIERLNDRLDKYISGKLKSMLAEKDKEIEELKKDVKSQSARADLYATIASTNATKISIAKAVCKYVCDEIKTYDRVTNKQETSYTEYVIGLCKILDQIEKEIENGTKNKI